jgi:hypothetical protein
MGMNCREDPGKGYGPGIRQKGEVVAMADLAMNTRTAPGAQPVP